MHEPECGMVFRVRRASARLMGVITIRNSRAEALRRLKPTLRSGSHSQEFGSLAGRHACPRHVGTGLERGPVNPTERTACLRNRTFRTRAGFERRCGVEVRPPARRARISNHYASSEPRRIQHMRISPAENEVQNVVRGAPLASCKQRARITNGIGQIIGTVRALSR
jgi:hypothetical protein